MKRRIMKSENRIFVIAALAALAVDLLFQQDAVNKISAGNTLLILGVLAVVNFAVCWLGGRRLLFTGSMIAVWLIALIWSAVIVRQNYGEWAGYVGIATVGIGLMTLGVFLFIGVKFVGVKQCKMTEVGYRVPSFLLSIIISFP